MTQDDQKKRNRILLVLFLGVLMGALDIAIVGPALTPIEKSFGVDVRTGAWVFTIYVLFNLIGTPLMAKLSDQHGRRIIYITDVTLFAAGSLIVALSQNFTLFIIGRAIQGFGAGGIFPVASAVIGDTFPPEKRGGALGLIGAVFGLAFVIGPILGGIILSIATWHWLFIINIPLAAVVIFLGARLLPTTKPETTAAFDWLGMLVVAVMLASLAYGVNQIDTAHFSSSLISVDVWPYLLVSIISLIIFIPLEKRASDPIVRLDLFKRRQMTLAYVLSAGAGLGESGLVFIPALAYAALNTKGVTESSASFLLMPVVLAMGFGSPLVGKLLDKLGSKVIIISGTLLLAMGMFMLGSFAANMVLFILSGVLIGVGLSALLGAPIRYIMLNEASAQDRSVAQGIITLFTSVGQLLAGALVGGVAASQGGGISGYSAAYLMTGVVATILVLISLFLKSRKAELDTVKENEAGKKFGQSRSMAHSN